MGETTQEAEGGARTRIVVPGPAAVLGGAGLLPFAGLAAAVWFAPEATAPLAAQALTGYAVAILSFMGGCRWGFAAAGLGRGPAYAPLALSVAPALYAWAVALLAPPVAWVLLALGFAGLLLADVALARAGGAPLWWPKLRWPLTLGAVASLLLAAAGA